jgi:hypothetical protein
MVIYAPETNLIFDGGNSLYGSAVGGTIRLTGGTSFHYDTQSANLTGYATQLVGWHEIRN